jgi:hypothetical protein
MHACTSVLQSVPGALMHRGVLQPPLLMGGSVFLQVSFVSGQGYAEAGLDFGGLMKEFLAEVQM